MDAKDFMHSKYHFGCETRRVWELEKIVKLMEEYAKQKLENQKQKILKGVSNYMWSEGCSCCRDIEAHDKHKELLGELLDAPRYDDNSGYDFYKLATDK